MTCPWFAYSRSVAKDHSKVKINKYNVIVVSGQLKLPADVFYQLYDRNGKVVSPKNLKPGIYFLEINGRTVQTIIKIK